MKENWQTRREERITEYITAVHIISFLTCVVAFISFGRAVNFIAFPYLCIIIIASLLLIYKAVIKYIQKNLFSNKVSISLAEAVYILSPLILTLAVVIITGNVTSPVKILLLIPVIISATTYGKLMGTTTASAGGFFLLFNSLTSSTLEGPNKIFEADLIITGVMLLTGWLIGGLTDIEKEVRVKLADLANRDDLTNLFNHRYFQENLRRLMSEAKANQKPLSLVMLDIDLFKVYNDTYGHPQGDEAIKAVGNILTKSISPPAFASRYGGEEFVLVLPEIKSKQAKKIAESISRQIEEYPFYGVEAMPLKKLTASFGVASFPEHANEPEELIKLADEALYKAKFMQKERVQVYFSVLDSLRSTLNNSEQDIISVVKTLITIINAKDRYTSGHSERVLEYSQQLAQKIGLPGKQISNLKHAAYLHDLGKIEIDRNILNKPETLSEQEWAVMKQHPVWGKEIIQSVDALKDCAPIILYHHENFDGTGYPYGISGESIPIESRILRLADSFDAMTTNRPYKKGKTINEACREIERLAGSWFDPKLAEAFLELIKKKFS